MRKLRIIEHISLDGVIQAPGGPDEDRDGDFAHGGWIGPHLDPALGDAILAAHGDAFDLILGRHTYDIWSSYWPNIVDDPMADRLNAATKYVATSRPDSLGWGPVEALGPEVADRVGRVKSEVGPDLILWGSSTLTPLLLGRGLVEEVLFLVYPVLLGTGKRFFSDRSAPRELALVSSEATASGVLMNTYQCTGPLRTSAFGDASGDGPTQR